MTHACAYPTSLKKNRVDPIFSGHICKKCCWDANGIRYETGKTTVVSLFGMIRFVKMAIFSGVQQLFFIRKMVTSGIFNC
jgi:hypothetical protein